MKDPAILFYTSDFLTGTMFMTNEQVGIYIRLLCAQHQHGGIIDKVTFNSMANQHEIIRCKFEETETGFYNIRMTSEMEKRSKKSTNMSETAKKVWEARKSNTNVKHKYNKSNTNVKEKDTKVIQPENENESINDKGSYNSFINWFNKKLNTRFRGDKNSKSAFNARISDGYKPIDFEVALNSILADNFHKEKNYKYVTPEYLLRPAQLEKWLNVKDNKPIPTILQGII